MRPEAKIEAALEAGRMNLTKKSSKNLKEAAEASKDLRRHPVGTDSDVTLTFWKSFRSRVPLNEKKNFNEQKSYFSA